MMEKIRIAIEDLSERERKLLVLLGVIFVVLVFGLPLYLMSSSIAELEEENESIVEVLRDISGARGTLAQREAERAAAQARYRQSAPPLASFLESQCSAQELDRPSEVSDQPEQVLGAFKRRAIRATMNNRSLRKVLLMLQSIENSRHPVALERVQIEHFRDGDDYNFQLGVIAYERNESEEEGDSDEEGMTSRRSRRGMRRAGPPTP